MSTMQPSCFVLLLVLLAAPFGADASLTNSSNPQLSSLSGDFKKMCQILGPLVPLPFVKPQELCATTGFTSDSSMCAAVSAIEASLLDLSKEAQSTTCSGGLQTPSASTSLTGAALPYPWSDQRPLPEALSTSLLASEGASFYWLFKNLLNFELYAGCAATNSTRTVTKGIPKTSSASTDWLVPPGWTVHSTIWQADGTKALGSGLYWPFSTVIVKGNSVVVFIRGTETAKDWMTDFNYRQVPGPFALGMNLPGKVHQGFATVAASLWPGIRSALHSLVKHKSSGTAITNVYVVGHSLGAAVSTLISYAAQDYLTSVKVDALLIAPPNVGDATFAAAFGKKVNARRVPFLYDLVPH